MKRVSKDKRSSKRHAVKRRTKVKCIDGMLNELEAQTRDVSIRGVFIYLQKKVQTGARLEVVLPLPDSITRAPEHWVRCKCRVVRVEDVRHGKEFGVAAIIEEYEPLSEAAVAEA